MRLAQLLKVIALVRSPGLLPILLLFLLPARTESQIDSLARHLVDTVRSILIDEKIPSATLWEKFMYPHRWYVKQLLTPRFPYYDTSYIGSNKKKLNLSVAVAKKFYGFSLIDIQSGQSLKFAPNNYYYLGFNCSNIILSFGFYPGIRFGAKPGRGNTGGQDLQLTVIGRRVITDINYQGYKGFYSFYAREGELRRTDADNYRVRPDINVFSFGASTNYVFNFRKFSLRGAFSFTDIQKRSAGSAMAGLYHSYLLFTSFDSTLIAGADQHLFDLRLHPLRNISQILVGLSGGYGYTFVYRQFILSNVINGGLGVQRTNYENFDKKGHTLSFNPALHLNVKTAVRYDNENFFIGIMATYLNNYKLNSSMFNTENFMGKIVGFCGYRFNLKQNGRIILRKLKLVDY